MLNVFDVDLLKNYRTEAEIEFTAAFPPTFTELASTILLLTFTVPKLISKLAVGVGRIMNGALTSMSISTVVCVSSLIRIVATPKQNTDCIQ